MSKSRTLNQIAKDERSKSIITKKVPATWKTVPDAQVRHVWKDEAGKEYFIDPDYYAESGTPQSEDGDDLTYDRTEVLS